MVAIHDSEGPLRLVGCAPLYKVPQTKWTTRLTVQLTVYVAFIGMSMAAGGLMPWLLDIFYGWKMDGHNSLYNMFGQTQGYVYENNNTYAFCPKNAKVFNYEPLGRGYPAPPLAPKGGKLYDAWYHKPVTLRGVSWSGFNTAQGGPDGLQAQGSQAATDFASIVYQLKLLGFNTVRLPFTFDVLQKKGTNLVQSCNMSTKAGLAQHATDPEVFPKPDPSVLPDFPVFVDLEGYLDGLCNTYMPRNNQYVIQRLLWTIQFLIGNGMYVVLDYHPPTDDTLAHDARDFARAWMYTWATVACLPNFASDIRGRLILDLLNDPDKLGLSWAEHNDLPGLDELYLTTMDSIENITKADAFYMLQGSARLSSGQLAAGDGFVTDASIAEHQLTDPKPFFNALLHRPYSSRVLLSQLLYRLDETDTILAAQDESLEDITKGWGQLATEGYCYQTICVKFPVVAGEMGGSLNTADEQSYYRALSQTPLAGWIWSAYNKNGQGGNSVVTDNWQDFAWPTLRYLIKTFGLQPWYLNVDAYLQGVAAQQADALAARTGADAAAAAEAAAAQAAAASNPDLDLRSVTEAVVPVKATAATADTSGVVPSAAATQQADQVTGTISAVKNGGAPNDEINNAAGIAGAGAAAAAQQTGPQSLAPPPIMSPSTASQPAAGIIAGMALPSSVQTRSAAPVPSLQIDTHANLPADGWDASLYYDTQLSVPAVIEKVPSAVPSTVDR